MQIITDNLSSSRETALAIGKFDGVHLGHRYLINKMLLTANEYGLAPAVLTFDPHPERFHGISVPLITTRSKKLSLLEQVGPELCFEVKFDEEFSNLSAEDFMTRYLAERLMAKAIIVGDDFHFGHKRRGNVALLQAFCEKNKIILKVVPRLSLNGETVSSSAVRTRIFAGDMETAADFLGRDYSCVGCVQEGDKMGRKIGFPTANMLLENELVPPDGVYAARLKIDGCSYKAMLYIGNRPTIKDGGRRFEVNILDYEGSLYEENLEVFILKKIRDDKKFNSIEDLVAQINKDRHTIASI